MADYLRYVIDPNVRTWLGVCNYKYFIHTLLS